MRFVDYGTVASHFNVPELLINAAYHGPFLRYVWIQQAKFSDGISQTIKVNRNTLRDSDLVACAFVSRTRIQTHLHTSREAFADLKSVHPLENTKKQIYTFFARSASFSATQGFKRLVCVCVYVTDFSDFYETHMRRGHPLFLLVIFQLGFSGIPENHEKTENSYLGEASRRTPFWDPFFVTFF